ncbi:MAG: hypothetical protein AAGJ46_18295 [Planctomycetota bacterium]
MPPRELRIWRARHRHKLRGFLDRNIDDSLAGEAAGPSRMELWARDPRWYLSPPKGAGLIRAILERIRRRVSGG